MIYEFRKGDERDLHKGEWTPSESNAGKSALLCCPDCGHYGFLHDHKILDDGTVEPSVVCTTIGCAFHKSVKLLGWKP